MMCPNCNTTLLMTERQGVEIDYCPKCRGIWLDRGELEKLIERSVGAGEQERHRERRDNHSPRDPYRSDDDRYRDNDTYYGKRKKKESWFSEIFDFD